MIKKHIITIAGKLGSGKSSTAKRVAEILNYQHYSTGDFMRAIADEKGITLQELSEMAEIDSSIDKALDARNTQIGDMDNIVLDSRLGFYFIPEAFKIFFELSPEIAANRILEDKKTNSYRKREAVGDFDTKETIIEKINNRAESEKKRYKNLYGIDDHTSYKNFDLIIDSQNKTIEEVANKIIDEYNKWLNN